MKKFYQICGSIATLAALLFAVGKVSNNFSKTGIVDAKVAQKGKTKRSKFIITKVKKGKVKKTYTVPKFNQIKLACYRPGIAIHQGKKFQITITGKHGANIKKIKTRIKNDQLTVYDKPTRSFKDGSYWVDITVPSKNSLKKIAGSNYSGSLSIANLDVPSVKFKSINGSADFTNANSNNSLFKLKKGNLAMSGTTLSNGSFVLNKGKIGIYDSKVNLTATLGKGNVDIANTKIVGSCSFYLNSGHFEMIDEPHLNVLNFNLKTGSNEKIRLNKKYYSQSFSSKSQSAPLLTVISKTGKISISSND